MKWAEWKKKTPREETLKAVRPEERLHKWKEYFQNLLVNSSKIIDKPSEMINHHLDIKQGEFLKAELDTSLKKKSEKRHVSTKYFLNGRMEDKEIWRYTSLIMPCCM